jgi:chorismate synthase
MSIQGVKAAEIGLGVESSKKSGSHFHDEILYAKHKGFSRKTNNAGGIEGGISNGENIILRASMKPIATLKEPLPSIDIVTKKPAKAEVQRADVCAVPAAGVVGEAVVAFELADALTEKFGGDSLGEMKRNFDAYLEQVRNF